MYKHIIHIACASDERYFPGLLATLSSIIINASPGKLFTIHVLDGGIGESSWKFLSNTLQKLGQVRLERYVPDMSTFDNFPKFFFESKLAYARLLLPKLVKEKKVIYVDSDILFLKDIVKLWEQSLEGKSAIVSLDTAVILLKNDCPNYEKIGVNPEAPYFNSGLMVMDLDKFRNRRIDFRAIEYLRNSDNTCLFHDQSALNVILYNDFVLTEQEWNTQSIEIDTKHEDLLQGLVDYKINYHFITSSKPWIKFDNSPQYLLFYTLLKEIGYSLNDSLFIRTKINFNKKAKLAKYLPALYKVRSLIKKIIGQRKKAEVDNKVAEYWQEKLQFLKFQEKEKEKFALIEESWRNKVLASFNK